jgi:hypothetical protein
MRRFRDAAIFVLAAIVIARLIFVFAHRPSIGEDGERFLLQAKTLLEHGVYLDRAPGVVDLALPPGYPVFVAACLRLGRDLKLLFAAQFLLSVAAIWLTYSALRPRAPKLALAVAALLALSPWTGRMMQTVASETVGIFLVSLAVNLAAAWQEGARTAWRAALLGTTIGALLLTSPGTAGLCFGLFVWFSFTSVRRPLLFGALLVGLALPMIPWQKFCLAKTGSVQPLIYYRQAGSWQETGFGRWYRTWSEGENAHYLLWRWYGGYSPFADPRMNALIHADATEEAMIRSAMYAHRDGKISRTQLDGVFAKLADERTRQHPFFVRVELPLRRAIDLWSNIGSAWAKETSSRAAPARALLFAFHWLEIILLATLVVATLWRPSALGWIIVGGALLYTVISATSGAGESRRNYVLYPALYFLAGISLSFSPAKTYNRWSFLISGAWRRWDESMRRESLS